MKKTPTTGQQWIEKGEIKMCQNEIISMQQLKECFKRLYQARRGEYNPNRPALQEEWQNLLDTLNQHLTLSEKERFVDEMKVEENVEAKICNQCENIMTAGYVIEDHESISRYCSMVCMNKAGISAYDFDRCFIDEAGNPLDEPIDDPNWNTYQYDWCQ